MADKKAVIVLAPQAELAGTSGPVGKLLKKGALIPNYTHGQVLDGAVSAGDVLTLEPSAIAEAVEKGTPLMVVDLGDGGNEKLEQALEAVLDGVDRRTVIAVAAKSAMALYGAGIDAKVGKVERACKAEDILPTLAAVGEFPLTGQCTGAVIYQALKNPNPKLEEIAKLKEALTRMEGALARDNREPWDKHDCA